MLTRCLALVAIAATLAGCVPGAARQHELERGTPYWFDYPPDRRGGVLVPATGAMRLCAEPAADVVLQRAVDLVARVDTPQSISAQGQARYAMDAMALAGRTQTIVFLREALYRLCEQTLNSRLTADQVAPLFLKILETSATLANAQLINEVRQTPAEQLPTVSEALSTQPPAVVLPLPAPPSIDHAPAE